MCVSLYYYKMCNFTSVYSRDNGDMSNKKEDLIR